MRKVLRTSHLSSERQNIGRKRQEEERQNVRKTLPVADDEVPLYFPRQRTSSNQTTHSTRRTKKPAILFQVVASQHQHPRRPSSLRIASEASSHLEVGPRDGSVGAPRRGVSRPISQNRSGTRGPDLKAETYCSFRLRLASRALLAEPTEWEKKKYKNENSGRMMLLILRYWCQNFPKFVFLTGEEKTQRQKTFRSLLVYA